MLSMLKNLGQFFLFQMVENPWHVDSIQAFLSFKCPECIFFSKMEDVFQDHAIENHQLSFALFGKNTFKEEILDENFVIEDEKLDKFDDLKHEAPSENDLLVSAFDLKTEVKEELDVIEATLIDPLEKHDNEEVMRENSYKCSECDKKFFKKYKLKQHIELVHKENQLYQCSQCNKSFSSNWKLTFHIKRIHEGCKPYNCTLCDFD